MKQDSCPFFEKCGGCIYLDKDFSEYKEIKKNFILSSFKALGISLNLKETITIPFGQRRRATFVASKGILGFNEAKSHNIVPVTHCGALTENLNLFLPVLIAFIKEIAFSGDISLLETPFGIDMHLKSLKQGKPQRFKKQKKQGLSADTRMALALFAQNPLVVRLIFDNEPIIQKVPLPFAPDSFLQPSLMGEKALINLIMENIESEKIIYDLFCGSGTFTKPLLEKNIRALGFDISSDTVPCLKENGVKRDLFRNPLLPEELNKADMIIMDPPRSGAKTQSEQLAKSQVKKIVMISCNPITAARDSKILIDSGYTLKHVTPVDQFIYTNHLEIVAVFTKE